MFGNGPVMSTAPIWASKIAFASPVHAPSAHDSAVAPLMQPCPRSAVGGARYHVGYEEVVLPDIGPATGVDIRQIGRDIGRGGIALKPVVTCHVTNGDANGLIVARGVPLYR